MEDTAIPIEKLEKMLGYAEGSDMKMFLILALLKNLLCV